MNNQYIQEMEKQIENLDSKLLYVKSGRPSSFIIQTLKVGEKYIKSMCSFSYSNQALVLSVYDVKNIPKITKSISIARLNLNIKTEGNSIILTYPLFSQEEREEKCKEVKQLAEKCLIKFKEIREKWKKQESKEERKNNKKACKIDTTEIDKKIAEFKKSIKSKIEKKQQDIRSA